MNKKQKIWHKGSCHCKKVQFEVRALADVTVVNCNCSICEKTGFQHIMVEKEDFRLLSDAEDLSSYRFNTGIANHTFCKTCGVKGFYTPRSHPNGVSVNYRCLEKDRFGAVKFEDFDGQNWEENVENLRENH